MIGRVNRINYLLKSFDRDLFVKHSSGRLDVCRKVDSLHRSLRVVEELPPDSQYLFSLTDDWKITGNPVDQGWESVYEHLNYLDAWRDDSFFKRIQENRLREEETRRKRFSNEVKARAYDLRRDFAKVTNDLRMGGEALEGV